MATCPECDAEVEVDPLEVEQGDKLSCDECGTALVVASVAPLELDFDLEEEAEDELGEDEDEDEKDDEDGDLDE